MTRSQRVSTSNEPAALEAEQRQEIVVHILSGGKFQTARRLAQSGLPDLEARMRKKYRDLEIRVVS